MVVPWNVEEATYNTNYAGPDPFDVSYQTSTDLTGLGSKGVLEVLNTNQWLDNPNYASTKAKFIPNTITKSTYKGKLYGLPCIIGGTVIYYNKDLLGKAGIANIPRTEPELMAAAVKVAKLGGGVWGHNVPLANRTSPGTSSTTASTTAASTSSRRTSRRSRSTPDKRQPRSSSTST